MPTFHSGPPPIEPTMPEAQTPDSHFTGEAREPVGYVVEALVDGKWCVQWTPPYNTEAAAQAEFGLYARGSELRVAALYTHPATTPETGNPASAGESGAPDAGSLREPKNGNGWKVHWWNESARLMLPDGYRVDNCTIHRNRTIQLMIKADAAIAAQGEET